jgi:hypothetical protein
MDRYCRVSGMLLTVGALFVFATPGFTAQLTQYYVPKPSPVGLTFSRLDPARSPIDEQWLLKDLTTALQARSGLPLTSAGEVTTELTGLRTQLDEPGSRILFEYVHLARNRNGDEWGETLTIAVSYRIEETKDVITVDLRPSETAAFTTRPTPGLFFLPTPKLGSLEKLFDDFSAIMNGAQSLQLRHSALLQGVAEASASPQTCIEKFDRLFGRYAYAKDEERVFDPKHDDVFLYRTTQESVPLKIAAVYYHGGSKVFYEAWIPFELHADGTVTGYALAPALTAAVHRVLEDPPAREAEGGSEGMRDLAKRRD